MHHPAMFQILTTCLLSLLDNRPPYLHGSHPWYRQEKLVAFSPSFLFLSTLPDVSPAHAPLVV
jgi:hypothetical protein